MSFPSLFFVVLFVRFLFWFGLVLVGFFNIWITSCRGKDCSTVERRDLVCPFLIWVCFF